MCLSRNKCRTVMNISNNIHGVLLANIHKIQIIIISSKIKQLVLTELRWKDACQTPLVEMIRFQNFKLGKRESGLCHLHFLSHQLQALLDHSQVQHHQPQALLGKRENGSCHLHFLC